MRRSSPPGRRAARRCPPPAHRARPATPVPPTRRRPVAGSTPAGAPGPPLRGTAVRPGPPRESGGRPARPAATGAAPRPASASMRGRRPARRAAAAFAVMGGVSWSGEAPGVDCTRAASARGWRHHPTTVVRGVPTGSTAVPGPSPSGASHLVGRIGDDMLVLPTVPVPEEAHRAGARRPACRVRPRADGRGYVHGIEHRVRGRLRWSSAASSWPSRCWPVPRPTRPRRSSRSTRSSPGAGRPALHWSSTST